MTTITIPKEPIKKSPQIVWAAVYGALSSGIPWMVFTTFFVLFSGLPKLSYLAGPFIWIMVWAVGGVFISKGLSRGDNPLAVGLIYGCIVGAVTGAIFFAWTYWPTEGTVHKCFHCSLHLPVIVALGMPTIIIRYAISLMTGIESFAFLHILTSIIIWALFGVVLGKFIKLQED